MEGVFPLSKSWVGVWQKCPWRAWVERVRRLQSPAGEAAQFGVRVHELWAKMVILPDWQSAEELLTTSPSLDYGMIDYLRDIWHKHPDLRPGGKQWIETWIGIDREGKRVDTKQEAILHGYLDRIILEYDGPTFTEVIIEDLKTGKWEQDDEFERDSYVLLAWALLPSATTVTFRRYYCQSGHLPSWTYNVETRDELLAKLLITVAAVEASRPIATPGKHCDSWYGAPCVFQEVGCPVYSSRLPAISDDPQLPVTTGALLAAFIADPLSADHETASTTVRGMLALNAFNGRLKRACATWVTANGPIEVSDGRKWGLKEKITWVVDKALALNIMVSEGLALSEIAKGINMSVSSLDGMGTRRYKGLMDRLNAEAITEKTSKESPGFLEEI